MIYSESLSQLMYYTHNSTLFVGRYLKTKTILKKYIFFINVLVVFIFKIIFKNGK